MDSKRLIESLLLRRELVPDPYGVVGFALAAGVLVSHLALACLASGPRQFLWSENIALEVLGHAWFILGPPLSVYLGLRNLLFCRNSLLPLLSVPLGAFLSLTTFVALALSFFVV